MTVAGWLRALAEAGTIATDSEEQRLPKTVLTIAVAGFIPLGLVWGLAYVVLGLRAAAAVPVAFSVLSAANLGASSGATDGRPPTGWER